MVKLPFAPFRPRTVVAVLGSLAIGGAIALLTLHSPGQPPRPTLTLYYADPQAMFLVPVSAAADAGTPPIDPPGPFAQAIFARLRQAPPSGLIPAMPADLKLLEATYAQAGWQVRVLYTPTGEGGTQEKLAVGALVRSLVSSTPGAQRVEVRLEGADGKPYESQHLDLGAPLKSDEFANSLGDEPPGSLEATVWWALPGNGDLVPVRVALPPGGTTPPHDALDRLVAGPPATMATFVRGVKPPGLQATWEKLDAGTAYVRISGSLADTPETAAFLTSLVLTETETPAVTAVRIIHDGPLQAIGPYKLDGPIMRPERINPLPAPAAQPS